MIGTSLGPYRILEQIGAGGMGEVYLAEDTRLGRKVAVKVLPAEFAADPERLARFEQEARAAAALNHPHIAAVFDVGSEMVEVRGGDGRESDSGQSGPVKPGAVVHYMVQEYLEGQSLRERLDKGALPLDQALDLATEVGEALVAAHKAGIIHRDLKPDNIFVTEDGHAKVLDFGLAKLTEMAAPTGASASMSPTMLGTVAGQVMGTAGYMAPEQINGEEVDARADLFAFGCVLYGMITGRQAFAGKNVHETLGRILSDEPPSIADIDDTLPVELYRIIRKGLAKSAAARYQTAADLVVDLKALKSDVEAGATQPLSGRMPVVGAAAQTPRGTAWKLWVPAVIVAAAVAAGATYFATLPEPQPMRRFEIPYPPETSFQSTFGLGLGISPDGTRIAFNADRQLWMRGVGDLVADPIRGTAGARTPFFSPDGEYLGFWGDGQIKKVAITGGAPISLGAAPLRVYGAHWADDGRIYFGQGPEGIFRVSENGGEPELVVSVEDGEAVGSPQLLPGGDWLLYTHSTGAWPDADIVTLSLSSGERKVIVAGGTDGRYVPTGHVVYIFDSNLLAVPFDVKGIERTGGPVALEEGVTWTGGTGSGQYAFSQGGDLVYMPGGASGGLFRLAMADRSGAVEPLPFEPRESQYASLSPDERLVALEAVGDAGDFDIWIFDIERTAELRLTREGSNRNPIWSPDGMWVYFASDRGGDWDIWRQRADRSQPAESVLAGEGIERPMSISADGSSLLYDVLGLNTGDIGILGLGEGGSAELVVATPAAELLPSFSPDGRFFAFRSDETGTLAVYARELASGRVLRVSTGSGVAGQPLWSRDGSEIFFADRNALWSAAVTTQGEFSIEAPVKLFDWRRRGQSGIDASADGQRFLFIQPMQAAATDAEAPGFRIEVVLNWFEDLKARVPTGR